MNILMPQQWRTGQSPRKATLAGWGRWMVLLLAPFSVLATDTWLGTETLKKDYEIAELNRDAKALSETREALKLQEADQITQDRIAMEAPDLGLVEPQPGQIKVVYYAETEGITFPESTKHAQAAVRTDTRVKVSSAEEVSSRAESASCAVACAVEGKPWNTDPNTKPAVPMPLAARLHEVIANVYASYLGDS